MCVCVICAAQKDQINWNDCDGHCFALINGLSQGERKSWWLWGFWASRRDSLLTQSCLTSMNATLRPVHCFNSNMQKIWEEREIIKMLPVGGDRKIIIALARLYCRGRQFSVTKAGEVANMDERREEKRIASCSRCCYLSCHISFKRVVFRYQVWINKTFNQQGNNFISLLTLSLLCHGSDD